MSYQLACLALSLIVCLLHGSCNFPDEVVDGVSVNGVVLGETTWDDVISRFHRGCETITHGTYSQERRCEKNGLSFYTKLDDPDKTVFSIKIREPYPSPTSKEIVCGQSTVREVVDTYGREGNRWIGAGSLMCLEYSGINFCADQDTFNEREGATVVTEITIDQKTIKSEPWQTGDPIDRLFAVRMEGTLERVLVMGGGPFEMTSDILFQYGDKSHYVQFASGTTTLKGVSWTQLRDPAGTFDSRFYLKGDLTEDDRLYVRYLERIEGTKTGRREVTIGVSPSVE